MNEFIKQELYKLESYNFELPPDLIAQYPARDRDRSRLLVVERQTGSMHDRVFRDITEYLRPGDTLVLNETKVIPARLFAFKDTGARVEILLLKKHTDAWEALVRPAKRLTPGTIVNFPAPYDEKIEILGFSETPGGRMIAFRNCIDEIAFIEEMGKMPLPPYIKREANDDDRERYQTVYASKAGSAAAPTAGLHFTRPLLDEIAQMGVNITRVLLHVGLGTFRPVDSSDIRQHQMHLEYCRLDSDTAQLLNDTRKEGYRIIAVGTTSVRTLESFFDAKRQGFTSGEKETGCFIYPGYKFRAIDGLVTNFHLPQSSLLMLVAAFAGYNNTMNAYHHAIREGYRFFSYGDAMLVV
ncbi:tRNA preQ1(34) S-adenosylmethionine ribosyltransferase-isomerase QueA [Syntrophomonas palmitatica]|uniref:tRNA preQ1(34) S-adenosylmethionine ribosyltransferase-isomerase QueA n=1 Tax=Syntrophomonas palmitatica TaxID=402877 RepID=UPI0006CF279D|nr:tRNA preQ1(34) S-adenosylmethionine ribosyltransferase-isomerase QueA [Syntrophomonas palmitatica]